MRYFPDIHTTISEDRCCPSRQSTERLRCLDIEGDNLTEEQTAFVLAQFTAAHILPPMVDLPCGSDLLNYRVDLRGTIGPGLLRELTEVLVTQGSECGWVRVHQYAYLSVIGAGVAARLDVTPGSEHLTLQIEPNLANELFHAGRAPDLPRSRLFLQASLYENVDRLLTRLRQRTWYWLAG